MVEAALILPVIVLLVLGIMEFGLLFTSYSTTTASSRSGARLAATAYSQAGASGNGTETSNQQVAAEQIALAVAADLEVLNNAEPVGMAIYRVNPSSTDGAPAGGFPGPNMTGGCTSRCIRFTWNPATQTFVRGTGSWTDADACGTAVDSIGVYVETEHSYISGILGSTRDVDGHTVMRLEPLPADQCS